jgi:hypothetical protein
MVEAVMPAIDFNLRIAGTVWNWPPFPRRDESLTPVPPKPIASLYLKPGVGLV